MYDIRHTNLLWLFLLIIPFESVLVFLQMRYSCSAMVWSKQKIFRGCWWLRHIIQPNSVTSYCTYCNCCWVCTQVLGVRHIQECQFHGPWFCESIPPHSKSLAQFKAKQPANLQKLCHTLWEDAWYVIFFICHVKYWYVGIRQGIGRKPPSHWWRRQFGWCWF